MTTDVGGGERAVRTPFATATCVKRTCRGQLRRALHLQVAIEANTRLVVATGDPQPGNRNDCAAYRESGITDTFAGRPLMADGGYRATRGDRALPQSLATARRCPTGGNTSMPPTARSVPAPNTLSHA
jgi:hypothetical protein